MDVTYRGFYSIGGCRGCFGLSWLWRLLVSFGLGVSLLLKTSGTPIKNLGPPNHFLK